MDVKLEEVHEKDQIVIRTQNSEYKFSVIDPHSRMGVLTGGSLGDQERESVLVGSLQGTSSSVSADSARLKPGARVLFYLSANKGVERLLTSAVTDIVHLHEHKHAA